jgi:hypothetical protein
MMPVDLLRAGIATCGKSGLVQTAIPGPGGTGTGRGLVLLGMYVVVYLVDGIRTGVERKDLASTLIASFVLLAVLRFQVLMYLRPPGAGPAKSDREQTRAGIERALRPWGSKVHRITRAVAATDVVKRLALSQAPR